MEWLFERAKGHYHSPLHRALCWALQWPALLRGSELNMVCRAASGLSVSCFCTECFRAATLDLPSPQTKLLPKYLLILSHQPLLSCVQGQD